MSHYLITVLPISAEVTKTIANNTLVKVIAAFADDISIHYGPLLYSQTTY